MNAPSPLSALIIEDDALQADIFQRAIESAGFSTELIADGEEARKRLEALPAPALVVLDLHLPEISGGEVLQHIRTASHLRDTLVILATADPRLASQWEECSDLVLIKPVSFAQLRDLAARLRQRYENGSA